MGFLNNLSGKTSNPWLEKGNELKKECQIDTLSQAIQCYNKAIELDPHCAEAWHNKGHCYHLLRKENEAIQCYDEAIKINSKYAEAWYNKGQSLRSIHQYTEAVFCDKKASDIDQEFKEFIEYSQNPNTAINVQDILETNPDGSIKKFVFRHPKDPRKSSK